jgi:hypothetical protein
LKILFQKKIEVIWNKIELFKDETQEKISKLFINNLEEEIQKIGSKLNSKIYDLIPKQLEMPFKAIIEGIYREYVNESIEEIKQLYKKLVNYDLNILLADLEEKDENISANISSLVITKPASEWNLMRNIYNNLTSGISSYNNKIQFDVPEENKNSILVLFNYINPYLTNIIDGFYYQVGVGQQNVNNALSAYSIDNIYKRGIANLTNNMNKQILDTINEINKLFKNFQDDVVSSFSKMENTFKNIVSEIDFEGFDYINRNRSLMEYDISEKEKVYTKIEEKYNTFKYNTLTKNSFFEISTKKEGLIISLSNSAKILTKDFYIYKHLIEQYTDNEKIVEYFNKLNTSSYLIKKEIVKFVLDISVNIDKALDIVNYNTQYSWKLIKTSIDSFIDKILDETFKEKLKSLENITFEIRTPNIVTHSYTPLTVEYINSDNQIVNTLDISIDIIDVYVGCKLDKINEYDFKMNVYAGGNVNLTAENTINNQVIESLKGNLASGEVGIEANYSLHNMSIDIDAYTNLNEVNYVVEAETIEEYMQIYNGNRYVPGKELHTSRNFSATHYDVVE